MLLNSELLTAERNIFNNTKVFELKINEINSVDYQNCHILTRNNENINQSNCELENNNNILRSEK